MLNNFGDTETRPFNRSPKTKKSPVFTGLFCFVGLVVAALTVAVAVIVAVAMHVAVTEVADSHGNPVELALTGFVGRHIGFERIAVGLEHLLDGGLAVGEEEDVVVFQHVLYAFLSLLT